MVAGRMHGNLLIKHVRLGSSSQDLYNILSVCGVIRAVTRVHPDDATSMPSAELAVLDAEGSLLIPSLCHAHIHLDKCFLLGQHDPLASGFVYTITNDSPHPTYRDFGEALTLTAKAKSRFASDPQDIYTRGHRLITDSIKNGVTFMRAHVEIDETVHFACLDAALKLKDDFRTLCEVQVAVFAQDPLYPLQQSSVPSVNSTLLAEAASRTGVSVIGSAPYVEKSLELARQNIALCISLALQHDLHLDFHLDYNLSQSTPPLIYDVIDELKSRPWPPSRRITIGHATRLALFSASEWQDLKERMTGLPISLVGLPQSDLYMMGRREDTVPALRGTLPVTRLMREHDIEVAMSVNNVQNAFTPQGTTDPLALCALGVALFQAGTVDDCEILLRSVSVACKRAIGEDSASNNLIPRLGDPADFVVLHGIENVQSAVLCPPVDRTTVKSGIVVSTRRVHDWLLTPPRS